MVYLLEKERLKKLNLRLNCRLLRKRYIHINITTLCQFNLLQSLNDNKKNSLGWRRPSDAPNGYETKPHVFKYNSVCSDYSQYAIKFSRSLIIADFLYFWYRPWYSNECTRRLHVSYLGSLYFVWFLSKAKAKIFSLKRYWRCLLCLLPWKNFTFQK